MVSDLLKMQLLSEFQKFQAGMPSDLRLAYKGKVTGVLNKLEDFHQIEILVGPSLFDALKQEIPPLEQLLKGGPNA